MQQGSFSALGTSVSLQTECVTDTETVPLEQTKPSVQVKVQITTTNQFKTFFYLLLKLNLELVSSAVTCAPGQFACRDGTCVPVSKLCDGTSDCPGGEDEDRTVCYAVVGTPSPPHITLTPPTSGKIVLHRSR